MRAADARALGQRAGRPEIPKLEPLLSDGNDGVRFMAAAAIIRLSQPAAKPPMRRPKKVTPAQPPPKPPNSSFGIRIIQKQLSR